MSKSVHFPFCWTDQFFICEDCRITQRVPRLVESIQLERLPNYHQVLQEHTTEGHRAYIRSSRQHWPPQIDQQAAFRIALRLSGAEHEMEYFQ